MNAIFINFENSKTSNSHRLLLNVADKINLKIIIWKIRCFIKPYYLLDMER